MSLRSFFTAAVALAVLSAACTSGSTGPSTTTTAETPSTTSSTAAPFEGTSYAGTEPAPEFIEGLDWLNTDHPLTLAELKGKVVLLDFWTYGCINCIHIIPDLKRLESEYPNELVVIGVHSAKFTQESGTENIRQIILRYGLEHPVVNDRDFQVWRTWGASAWPTTVLIDPAGNIVGGRSGEGVYEVMQPVIDSLVREFDADGLLDRTPLSFTLEGSAALNTVLSYPGKVLADLERDRLFIADTGHHRVVAARISDGTVLGVYGNGAQGYADGAALEARFDQPQGMALSADASTLYVADLGNHSIRAVSLDDGMVSTVAGTGARGAWPPIGGTAATVGLHSPWALELDPATNTLYVAMAGSHQIWRLDLDTDLIVPFAGNARESNTNGPLLEAELAQPSGLALDGAGRLYFADSESSSIRYAETNPAGVVGLLAGPPEGPSGLFEFGDVDGTGSDVRLQHPLGVAVWNGLVYFTDTYNSKIKVADPSSGAVSTLFGSDPGWRDGSDPLFYEPGGLDIGGGRIFVADTNNHSVRIVDLVTGEASTLVLAGIERFMPADENYRGTTLDLGTVTLGEGTGRIVVDVTLPPGHKVNDDAPSSVSWSGSGSVIDLGPLVEMSLTGTTFPVVIPITTRVGSSALQGDFTLIWCAVDAQSLCFIEQFRAVAAVTVESDGADEIRIEHQIRLPSLDT